MEIEDVLRILKNGAEKPKDDLNDYTKGKRDGQVQAYSHAWTLVKNLSLSDVSNCSCINRDTLTPEARKMFDDIDKALERKK